MSWALYEIHFLRVASGVVEALVPRRPLSVFWSLSDEPGCAEEVAGSVGGTECECECRRR